MKFFVAIKICDSLVVLWLRLFVPIEGVPGSAPDEGTHGRVEEARDGPPA